MKKKSTFLKLFFVVSFVFSVNSIGIAQFAGVDQEICVDNTTLTATPGVPPGNWSLISGNGTIVDPTVATTTVTGLALGSNVFRWTDQQGWDEVIITNNSVTANAGIDINVSVDTAQLSANDPALQGAFGYWALLSGNGVFDKPTLYNTYVRNLLSGQNTFRWTVDKGICSSYDDVIVTATPIYAGDDQTICKDTTYLNATPSPGGFWELVGSSTAFIENISLYNTRVTFIDPLYNPHQFVWHANGLTDTMQITNNMVYANIISVPNEVCGDVILSANQPMAGETGLWTVNTSAVIINPTLENTNAVNLAFGPNLFTWTISNGLCTADSTVVVNLNTVVADAGVDIQSCSPDNIQLAANLPGPGTGQWVDLFGGATFSNTSINNAWVSGLYSGTNQLEWMVQNKGCIDRDTVTVEVIDLYAVVQNGDIVDVCDSFFVGLTANPPIFENGETGDWLPLNSPVYFDDHTAENTTVRGLQPGVNQLTWNIYKGACSASDTLTINYFNPQQSGVSQDINLFFDNAAQIDTVVNIYAFGEAGSTFGYWTVAQGNATIIDNSLNGTVHVTDTTNSIVIGTMGNAACQVSDSILIITGLSFIPGDTVTHLDWTDPNDWANGAVPGEDDSVTIFNTNALIDGDTAKCNAIYISSGSSFEIRGGGALYVNTIDLSQNNKRFKTTGDANLTVAGDGILRVGYGETDQKELRIGSGGILTVENNPQKATGSGGSLYVRGGSVIIEQDAEKATGSGGTMYIRGSVIIEQDAEKLGNLKLATTSSNNLRIRPGGSVIIEQDAEKSTSSGGLLRVRGGSVIIEQDAEKVLGNGGLLRVRSGSVIIEQDAEKATNVGNGKLYVSGGSVIIEQDAEKTTYKTEIIAPQTEIHGGQILIGKLSNVKITGSGFRTGSIIIEQDAEKSTNIDTSLIIKTGGSLLIDNNLAPSATFSLSLGVNTYVTFEKGSTIDLDYALMGMKPIVLKPNSSLLDMNSNSLSGKFEHIFVQNTAELFTAPFRSINSGNFTSNANIETWNENTNQWDILASTIDFAAMEGFKIEYLNQNDSSILSGTLNSGDISIGLDYSSSTVLSEAGWNLTGNPYPSAILWDSVATDNISAAVYTYNEQTKQYNVYMKGGISLNGALPYLPVGKAFFVKANSENASFKLTNNARTHYDFTTPLKGTPNNYLKLAVEGNTYVDEAVIRFLSDATDDYDSQLDAFKLLAENGDVPQIYSLLPSDESMMAINTLTPPGNNAITVPLNFKANIAGTYKIIAGELNFDAAVSVVLKDLKNNITQDLKTNPEYTFEYAAGDPEKRFEIQFGAGITNIEHSQQEPLKIDVFSNGNNINIRVLDNAAYRYEIYDINGKLIKHDKLYIKGLNTIPLHVKDGVYIVKVLSGNQAYSKQIPIVK